MIETDIAGFVNELVSALQSERNGKPVRISIKKHLPQVKGCKKKRKLQQEKIMSGDDEYECHHLVRLNDGKRKTRVMLKNEKETSAFSSELGKILGKVESFSRTQKKK